MERDQLTAYGALVGAQLLFATLPVAGKFGLDQVHFLVFSLVRMSGAAVLLAVGVMVFLRPKLPAWADVGRLGVYALFGIVINQILFLWGLSLTTATNAALIITTIPVITYAMAVAFGDERLDVRRGIGILVALSGVLVLLDPRGADLSNEHLWGNLLVLVNSVSYGLYLVISRPMLQKLHPLTMTAWLFVLGTLVTWPIALLVVGWPGTTATWSISREAWLVLGYIVLGPTVGTYAFNLTALSRLSSSTVAAFIYLQPVVGVFLAW
ncbi:MAG: DMT family transporter, partial [Candidatus Thermoplasmatota archaeon]|nr:DMT family transporter [Candidatus Thermoplasmatota archaeon]